MNKDLQSALTLIGLPPAPQELLMASHECQYCGVKIDYSLFCYCDQDQGLDRELVFKVKRERMNRKKGVLVPRECM